MTWDIFAFGISQYLLLAVSLIAAYGLALPITGWIGQSQSISGAFQMSLRLITGIGLTIVLLFAAGTLGILNKTFVSVVVGIGWILFISHVMSHRNSVAQGVRDFKTGWSQISVRNRLWLAILFVLLLPHLIMSPSIPHALLEVVYHLPHAKYWATHGSLAVNKWLYYPLFPYNMNLLYAASLVFGNDTLPHLFHMSAGLLAYLLTFAFGRQHFGLPVGILAALMVLASTMSHWDKAYPGLGLMCFWAAALICLALRHQTADSRYSYLAAFLAGLSVGFKPTALMFLPVFIALALVVERRWTAIARSILIFTIFGSYWYVRSWLISGDPIHPLGGDIFGYWEWSKEDVRGLDANMQEHERERPIFYILVALLSLLYWRSSSRLYRCITVAGVASFAIWCLLMRGFVQVRYMMPAFPLLSILAAMVLVDVWSRFRLDGFLSTTLDRIKPMFRTATLYLILLVAVSFSITELAKSKYLYSNKEARKEVLITEYPAFALLNSISQPIERPLYQLGFEETYYLGEGVMGLGFGSARHSDVISKAHDADQLADHLLSLGAKSLVVHKTRSPFSEIDWDDNMSSRFRTIAESEHAILYQLIGQQNEKQQYNP